MSAFAIDFQGNVREIATNVAFFFLRSPRLMFGRMPWSVGLSGTRGRKLTRTAYANQRMRI